MRKIAGAGMGLSNLLGGVVDSLGSLAGEVTNDFPFLTGAVNGDATALQQEIANGVGQLGQALNVIDTVRNFYLVTSGPSGDQTYELLPDIPAVVDLPSSSGTVQVLVAVVAVSSASIAIRIAPLANDAVPDDIAVRVFASKNSVVESTGSAPTDTQYWVGLGGQPGHSFADTTFLLDLDSGTSTTQITMTTAGAPVPLLAGTVAGTVVLTADTLATPVAGIRTDSQLRTLPYDPSQATARSLSSLVGMSLLVSDASDPTLGPQSDLVVTIADPRQSQAGDLDLMVTMTPAQPVTIAGEMRLLTGSGPSSSFIDVTGTLTLPGGVTTGELTESGSTIDATLTMTTGLLTSVALVVASDKPFIGSDGATAASRSALAVRHVELIAPAVPGFRYHSDGSVEVKTNDGEALATLPNLTLTLDRPCDVTLRVNRHRAALPANITVVDGAWLLMGTPGQEVVEAPFHGIELPVLEPFRPISGFVASHHAFSGFDAKATAKASNLQYALAVYTLFVGDLSDAHASPLPITVHVARMTATSEPDPLDTVTAVVRLAAVEAALTRGLGLSPEWPDFYSLDPQNYEIELTGTLTHGFDPPSAAALRDQTSDSLALRAIHATLRSHGPTYLYVGEFQIPLVEDAPVASGYVLSGPCSFDETQWTATRALPSTPTFDLRGAVSWVDPAHDHDGEWAVTVAALHDGALRATSSAYRQAGPDPDPFAQRLDRFAARFDNAGTLGYLTDDGGLQALLINVAASDDNHREQRTFTATVKARESSDAQSADGWLAIDGVLTNPPEQLTLAFRQGAFKRGATRAELVGVPPRSCGALTLSLGGLTQADKVHVAAPFTTATRVQIDTLPSAISIESYTRWTVQQPLGWTAPGRNDYVAVATSGPCVIDQVVTETSNDIDGLISHLDLEGVQCPGRVSYGLVSADPLVIKGMKTGRPLIDEHPTWVARSIRLSVDGGPLIVGSARRYSCENYVYRPGAQTSWQQPPARFDLPHGFRLWTDLQVTQFRVDPRAAPGKPAAFSPVRPCVVFSLIDDSSYGLSDPDNINDMDAWAHGAAQALTVGPHHQVHASIFSYLWRTPVDTDYLVVQDGTLKSLGKWAEWDQFSGDWGVSVRWENVNELDDIADEFWGGFGVKDDIPQFVWDVWQGGFYVNALKAGETFGTNDGDGPPTFHDGLKLF